MEDPAPVENCDHSKFYWNDTSWNSVEEIRTFCKENEYTEKQTYDAISEAEEFGIKERWDERQMFLTETDAEQHLKLNYYHYSLDAHTYVKHAWRAPELDQFIKDLMCFFEIQENKK